MEHADDAGLDVVQPVADDRPVRRDLEARKSLYEFRKLVEQFRLDSEIDAVHASQRHYRVFERYVAGPLARAGNRDMRHGSSIGKRRDGIRHTEAEVLVTVDLDR